MSEQRLVVIASPGLSTGFSLVGVPVIEAADGPAAARQVERLADEESAAVIIMEDSLYESLPDELLRRLRRSPVPVVISVPGPDWATGSSAHDYIVGILQRAIGYRVRLQ